MQKAFLITLIALSTISLKAQPNLDSLWNIWNDTTLADTSRLKAMGKIASDVYLYTQPDSAFYFSQIAYDLAESKGLKKQMGQALTGQGSSFWFRGNYSKALEYYQRSLRIYEEIDNKPGIAYSLSNIGLIYSGRGNVPKAMDYFQRALKLFKEQDNKSGTANTLNNMGGVYEDLSDTTRSLDYFEQGLNINEEIGNKVGICNSLNNVGWIHFLKGDYTKALAYYERSLKLSEEIGLKFGIANTLNNIGSIYLKQGKNEKAIEFCQRGLKVAQESGDVNLQKDANNYLYEAYKAIGNDSKALEYHEQMLVLTDSLKVAEASQKLQQMEFQEQMLADSLKQEGEKMRLKMVNDENLRKESRARNMAIGAGILLLFVAIGFYSRARYIRRSRTALQIEKDRSDDLLLNILPAEIAEELKAKGRADARDFDMVSILFTDFKEFTQTSEKLTAKELVAEINTCFEAFDAICGKHGIEKIKTIGDAYMAAGGLPVPTADSVKNTVRAALEMQVFILARKAQMDAAGIPAFDMRIGIHTGPVVAGIVGVKKFQYDIWGDTVNTASRMESAGEVGKVNISGSTYELVKADPHFRFSSRGRIEVKGKGEMEMYFVNMEQM